MIKKQNDTHDNIPSRKAFILTGVAVGVLISVWYLYRLHLQKMMPGVYVKVDPLWAQFVNVALIFFASIFQFSLLHKLVAFIMRRLKGKRQ
jgi:hypothetical protein